MAFKQYGITLCINEGAFTHPIILFAIVIASASSFESSISFGTTTYPILSPGRDKDLLYE